MSAVLVSFLKLNHRCLVILVRERERGVEAPKQRSCVWSGRSCDLRFGRLAVRGGLNFHSSVVIML